MSNVCAVRTCSQRVASTQRRLFLCDPHWNQLPQQMRDDIHRSFQLGLRSINLQLAALDWLSRNVK